MPIGIELTTQQVEEIQNLLSEGEDLETDERALLSALLEMAQNHPCADEVRPAWRYMRPR
jgi:hypothetical protein